MPSSHVDAVTLDRLEYESLLRDRALAEKVRGMSSATGLYHNWRGNWERRHLGVGHNEEYPTPEEALGVEEVGDE